MSQRGKRGNRLENENSSHLQPPIKRRKGRPPTVSLNYDPDHEAPTTSVPVVSAGVHAKMGSSAPSSTVWQARSVTDLKIYNRSSSEAPAELFRKDLISAMKLPDSEPLSTDEYWVITDQWKQEWERGVQVPVNPDSLPEPSVKMLQTPVVTPKHDFKLPKNKYIRITKDETFSSELHYLSNVPALAESACSYDLDQTDEIWLKLLNNDRAMSGFPPISDEHFERVIEELEVRCWDKIQAIMRSEEGLGIEYDENVICDVCRSPDSEEANEMVFCDKCNICVHQACYGITTIPSGQWLCRTCSMEKKPDCVLCPNKGGAMKSTRSGKKWAHVSCALWIPEVSIGCVDRMEPITKISNIPQSRWALLCILCREKVGACIQCSVKTCKTAYHVTCAFQHGLEMRAIIEEGNSEDGVKLRSYCLKHSVSKGKKDKSGSNNGIGSGSEDDDCRRRKLRKDMTSEERNQVRAMRLQEVEAEFDKHVNIKDISCHLLDVDQEAIPCIYNYWILKRKSGYNRPLIPRKAEDVDMISNKQEQADIEKKKMFVHLRQDLERVRNLCYMVNRREKFSRSFFKLREQIFHKQIAVLSESSSQNYDDSFINVVLRANNLPSVYDRFYSSGSISPSESPNNNIESIIEKIKGIQKPADSDVKQNRKEKSGKTGSKFTYTKIHVNGISDRKNSSIYDDSCSSTNSDDDKLSSSTDGRKSVKKKPQTYTKSLEKRKRRKTLLSVPTLDSSSEDESMQMESQMPKKNQSLHQMEKDLSSTDDSDELMPMKNTGNRTAQKKASMAIYSDSDTTDKEKTDNTVSDSQQHMFRTKAAMKEFTLYSAKSKQEPLQKRAPTIKSREHERVIPKLVDTSDKVTPKDKEKLKIEKSPSKVKKDDKKNKQPKSKSNENDRDINKLDAKRFPTDFLVVPQRQAAKKASENMRSTNLYTGNVQKKDSRDGRLDEKESERIVVNQRLKDRESKDEDREKDREREREKDKDKDKERSKPRGRPPKHLKDENRERSYKDYNSKDKHSDQKSNIQSSPEKLIKFEKEDGKKIDNNLIVAYVPQRQAAKKAAEHIKSGMGKTAPVDQISAQGEEKDKERDKEKDKDKEREKSKDKDKDKEREKERLKDKEHDSDKEKNTEREKSIEKHLDEKEIEESMKIKTTDWESSTEKGIVDGDKVEKGKTKSNEKKEPSSAILLSSTSSDYSSSSSTYSSSSSGESDNETNDHERKGSSSPRSRFASISDEKAKEEVPVKEYDKDTENNKEIMMKSKLSESDEQDDSTSICNNNIQKEIESISLTTDSKINDLQEISSVNSLPNSNNNILQIEGQSTESIDLPEINETHERKKLDSCFVSQKVEPVENDVEPRNCLDYFISDRDVLEEPVKANEVNNHHNDVLNFPNKICDSVDVPDQTSCEDTKNIQKPTFILDLSDSQDETPKSFTTEHDSVKVSHTDTQEGTNRSNNYKQRTPEIIDVDSESLESVKSKEDNSRQSDKELQNKTNLGIDIENSKIISTETKNAELLETFRDKNLNDASQSNINVDKLTCTQTKNRLTQPNDTLLDLVSAELPNNLDNEQKPIGIRHNDAEDFLKRTICDFTAESIFESKPNEEDSARETMNLVEKLRQKYKRSSSNNSTKPEDIVSNQIENKATDLKLKSDVPISADVFHQNAKVTTCPRKDDLLVLPDTNATQDGSILSGLTANEINKIDMTTSKEHLPATLNDTSVGFMNNDTSLTLDIARNPCKDIMAIIEKRAESYLERQLTAKADKIVKSNTDCFDNIAARNFFKDDFGDIQEKENMCVSSMAKLDCEYDDSTRMQSPFTNTANIWNENDLIIQTRRSISTSPSSISESNDDFKPVQSNKQLAMNEEQPTTHHQTQLQSHHQSIQVSHHPQQHHQSQHQTPLQSHVQHQAHNQTQLAAPHQPQTQSHATQHPHSQHDQSNNQQQQSQHSHQHQSQQQHQPPQQQQQQQSHLNSVRCDTQNLDKHSFNMLQTLDMSTPHFPMQQQSQTVVNGVDMLGSYNFPENNQFNGPVSLFAPPPPPVSNLNVQMPFPSPGAGMFPPTLGGGIPLSQATTNQSTTALYQHIVKHDQNISSVSQNNEGHYSLLGQPCGAAFTSSSHNLALTAAIVSTSVGGPVPISSPQMIHSNNFNLSNPNLMASTHDTGSSLNQMMNCDVLPNNNLGLKDSPSKRTSARFNQQIKSPQMHKSPGKSPRQMELLSKQHNASNANKTKCEVSRPRNRSTRGANSNRARGRGRGRGRLTAISQMPPALEFDNLGSIHNHLAGTVYDLDFDDDLTSSCNVEDLKSLRDRRRSFDCRGNSQNVSETKFTSPNHHSKFRNSITQRTISELKPPPVISSSTNELSNTHSLLHNIHPVLPGPVDMRTYNSGFENQTSSSQEAYNSHLLGAFASGTAEQTLPEFDEEVEKEFQSVLKASGTTKTTKVVPEVVQTELQTCLDTTSEEISIDSDTTNTKVSLSDSRNQLKLKIKGPLAHPDTYNSSTSGANISQSLSSEQNMGLQLPSQTNCSLSTISNTTGTSSLRRMRKKELLRQYWNQDMNNDDSACLPPTEATATSDQAVNRSVGIPKAVDSLSSIPTKDDYKDYTAADPRKRKKLPGLSRELRQLDIPYESERPERRRSAGSTGSNMSSTGNINESLKVSMKRRNKVKASDSGSNSETPRKLKIKIGNNVIETGSDSKRVVGYPPKKRLSNIVPSLEIIKRDSMNFRKQVMADFDEEEKEKRPRTKPKKEYKDSRKKKKKEKRDQVQVIDNTKIIIRIGKRKAADDIQSESNAPAPSIQQSHSQSQQDSEVINTLTSESNAASRTEKNPFVGIRLKIARKSDGDGYVIDPPKDKNDSALILEQFPLENITSDHEQSTTNAEESGSQMSNPATAEATVSVLSTHKTSDLKGQNNASNGCQLLPLNKDCEVR